MDKFKTVLDIANKQTNLGFGVVALLTAGGEQIFSTAVFQCPCSSELNFIYGMVFLLVPALALLLLGYILNKRTWKLMTGLCHPRKGKLCSWKRLTSFCKTLSQITAAALVAPSSWIAVALLSGNYYECAMTGTHVEAVNERLCGEDVSRVQCQQTLYRVPCAGSDVKPLNRDDVMLRLKAQSQILGWLLIASLMLFTLLQTCVARCTSPISYLQLKFWRAYVQEENKLMESYTAKHVNKLAERNLESFFNQTPPKDITTPSNKDWDKISSLYKFSTKDHFYSTLHECVENCQETDYGLMKMASIRSSERPDTPAVLDFVDGNAL